MRWVAAWADADFEPRGYPHQRAPGDGTPFLPAIGVDASPGAYVAHEWDEVVRAGVASNFRYNPQNLGSDQVYRDGRVKIFSCPDMSASEGYPHYDPNAGPINPGDDWWFPMGYVYTGGVTTWDSADPSYSPIKPTDPPSWVLMVDFVSFFGPGSQTVGWPKDTNAHLEDGQSAGGNHLFNDGHVSWYQWNGGANMRTNLVYAGANYYMWRRTMEAP